MGPAEDAPVTEMRVEGNTIHGESVFSGISLTEIKPTFAFKRAKRGADRTFVDTTYPCKHESRTFPLATSDGEFVFKIPTLCPKCTDMFYLLRSDGDVLNRVEIVPQL